MIAKDSFLLHMKHSFKLVGEQGLHRKAGKEKARMSVKEYGKRTRVLLQEEGLRGWGRGGQARLNHDMNTYPVLIKDICRE